MLHGFMLTCPLSILLDTWCMVWRNHNALEGTEFYVEIEEGSGNVVSVNGISSIEGGTEQVKSTVMRPPRALACPPPSFSPTHSLSLSRSLSLSPPSRPLSPSLLPLPPSLSLSLCPAVCLCRSLSLSGGYILAVVGHMLTTAHLQNTGRLVLGSSRTKMALPQFRNV